MSETATLTTRNHVPKKEKAQRDEYRYIRLSINEGGK